MLLHKFIRQLDLDEVEILYLSCGSLFDSFCTLNESRKRDFTNNQLIRTVDCIDCNFTANLLNRVTQKNSQSQNSLLKLADYFTHEDKLLELGLFQQISDVNLTKDFDLDGIPIVRFALYETMIKFKKMDTDFSVDEKNFLEIQVKNLIRVFLSGVNFFSETKNIDAVLCHSPEYGANNVFVSLASKRNIPVYEFRGSSNLSEMSSSAIVSRWDVAPLANSNALEYWDQFKNTQLSSEDLRRVREHQKQLLSARSPFVYSSKFSASRKESDVYKILGINNQNPIMLLALSSTDEILASSYLGRGSGAKYPGAVFGDQFEWVEHTISWAANRPGGINLVIRLHPRDLPNKRDSLESAQYSRWVGLLKNLPSNVFLNHPDQLIALNEICRISQCLVTGWSSTALEALSLGKPVVTYDSTLPGYPVDLTLTGTTKDDYFLNLEVAMKDKNPEQHRNNVDIWLGHSLVRGSLILTGGLFNNLKLTGPVLISKILSGLDRYLFFIWRPIELRCTIKKSPDEQAIRAIFRKKLKNVYEVKA